ncbi:putative porin [Flavobacterium sp. UBA6135]|uniref:putative porin n=1 Tax=Flavobacterium sp. UBA6135 TaxID=1946553 RepID=UPI0025BDEC02|nr:putative porin [Flavobacterium sp. UBA6135]
MRIILIIVVILFSSSVKSQTRLGSIGGVKKGEENESAKKKEASQSMVLEDAKIEQYQIFTIERDTTVVDTSLTIKKEYSYNYLRRDIFGLLPFANEGYVYTVLDYGLNSYTTFPEMGFKAKHFGYMDPEDISYYKVATPLTELYFKTVMEQGQSLDAFITLNTSERLNFSMAYKGLRSLGKYVNQLASNGNFRFTTNYTNPNERYHLQAHFTSQDFSNGENGGIVRTNDFESDDEDFKNRVRLQVFFEDATSFLKGNRYFINHSYHLTNSKSDSKLTLLHQFNYEHKFFEFKQRTLSTTIITDEGSVTINRLGDSYRLSNINDQTRYNRMYNKFGASYEHKVLGSFVFFTEDFRFNQYYNRVLLLSDTTIPSTYSDEITTIGGQYSYRKGDLNGKAILTQTLSNQDLSSLDLQLAYQFLESYTLDFHYQAMTQMPDNTYVFFQSNYVTYNWNNSFKNEKVQNIKIKATTPWINATAQFTSINDFLYFSNDDPTAVQLLVTPKQFDQSVTYFSLKAEKEFKFRNFALDNTLLYQKTDQSEVVLNVPELVLRNTFYYSNHFFKKALFLQTGVTFTYFTDYYADDYNPLLGSFFVQDQKKIGGFPMFDYFINAKIKQARLFLKAEHFNSSFTSSNFYTAPNYPYRDFMVRFGIIWNFFQ